MNTGRRAARPPAGTAGHTKAPRVRDLPDRLKAVTRNSILTAVVEEARYDVATDEELLGWHREGDDRAAESLLSRYRGFARMKARSYFLAGADRDDIVQEAMIGLYKAIRDFLPDRQASFRGFADVCITRQLITAIRNSRCQKHTPLNSYVSLSKPIAPDDDPDRQLMDVISGPGHLDPLEVVIATEDLDDIKAAFAELLSEFETEVLQLYADGKSYQDIALLLEREVKSIDNALQRIKRKIEVYLRNRDPERPLTSVRRTRAARVPAGTRDAG
jgi:RNA polymerase sporulation-specific sigma factor